MNGLKKYWYVITLLFVTLGLGVVTYQTSLKLSNTGPVAPNVPQDKPRAVSEACTFRIVLPDVSTTETVTPTTSVTGTLTPTITGTLTPTITGTLTPTITGTLTPTATTTPTETPTPTDAVTSTPTETPTGVATATPTGVATATPTTYGNVTGTPTPTSSDLAYNSPTPTEIPSPETPVSGSPALLGLVVAVAGFVLLVFGFAF